MQLAVDPKSVALVAFAATALFAALGAQQNGDAEVGRYQISASARDSGRYLHLLDTRTGRLWERLNREEFEEIRTPIPR